MASTPPSRTADKIIIRLPDGLRDRLAAAAKANNRSTNAEVVARLEATFNRHMKPPDIKHYKQFKQSLEGALEFLTIALEGAESDTSEESER